ncbi:Biotin carboxylase [Streptoalloteichus tenebrarius]|uniref:Biotin carboxylase n=1 Tax=Streptoalloteichus tenebrarius (strain ATCC 17920 / DSM 40477 / JCM 4838 / CBS 697.72 / NBRC 16177 / NCIMB 11028 / NRRL B-12390 / A12253. 1 / ISP 5477) TaxID=1933 RepID=A0ABT1HQP4_STRSD|nr:ATP-grasp domain-containing protein [Streptoalloteichus tenebrarius]MCP2257839.1 Biotin carboxylase [Streptoalloteichus tenebrarius]BFE99799.1 ATP-grasp domain-containing protein [Streptoalloteichus tenebrarius]
MTLVSLEALTFGLGRLVDAARARDHRLRLLTCDRGVYRHELERLAADPSAPLDVVDVDTFDTDAVRRALAEVPDLRGLISSTDTWSLVALDLLAELGLPGPAPDAVRLVRDKARLRDHLHRHGLSRGASHAFDPATTTAAELAAHVSYPAIVKDTAGTGSQNVWLLNGTEDLEDVLAAGRAARLRGVLLVEPYFVGPLYSAETLTWDGETRLLGISSRGLSPEPLFREESLSFPVAFSPERTVELTDWITRVLAAVGFDNGFAHTEFVMTARGPEVVEINPRLGGALLGEAVCRSVEHNIYDAFLDLALGQRPALMDAPLKPVRGTAQVLLYADRVGVFRGVEGLDRLAGHPGDPAFFPTAAVGRRIEHLADQRGSVGIVFAEGDTAELALHNVLSAVGKLRVRVEEERPGG